MAIARMYAYTDAGAPTLSGTQGALKSLLKAILVGSSGVAYGTGGAAKPSLGWSAEYETTAKAIFRGGARGTGMMLRVDDDGPGAASYKEAFVFGCESAVDVDTPVDRFPTIAQLPNGQVWRKSTGLSGAAVPWWLWGDDIGFYLMVNWYGAPYCGLVWAGDIVSLKDTDSFAFVVGGAATPNSFYSVADVIKGIYLNATQGGADTSLVVARSYDHVTKSVPVGVSSNGVTGAFGRSTGVAYPAAVNGGLLVSPIEVHQQNMYRGMLRGCYNPMHTSGLSPLTTTVMATKNGIANVTITPQFGDSSGMLAMTHDVEW